MIGPSILEGVVHNSPERRIISSANKIYIGLEDAPPQPLTSYNDIVLAINNRITPTWFPECDN